MDPRMAEEFLMLMEDELEQEQELETVEDPWLTQDFAPLMEDQDEEEEAEAEEEQDVSLEDGLLFLFQRFIEMREEFPAEECDWYEMDPEERTQLALERVEEVFRKVLEEGDSNLKYPTLNNWDNVKFTPGYGLQPLEDSEVYLSQMRRETLPKFLHVLDVMRTLLQSNTRTTKRDIYYQHVRNFTSQKEVDRLVSIAVAMLEVPRLYLGVVATSKGLVVGNISFVNSEGVRVDCSLAAGGETIPQDVPDLDWEVDADFVLVVEKDAVFQRLLEERILSKRKFSRVLMVTGKGVPDLATRQLVSYLAIGLPVLILTDCDPYGLEIFLTYKYGSLASSYCQEPLAAPFSWWLGVHPADLQDLDFPLQDFSDADRKRIIDITEREYIRSDPVIQHHVDLMWDLKVKAEIQQVFEEREPGFLVNSYLPNKIDELQRSYQLYNGVA